MSASNSAAAPKLGPLAPGTMPVPGQGGSRATDRGSATNPRPTGVTGSTGKEPAHDRRFGSVTEAQLIQRLKDGDQTVARTLYDSHVDRIFRLCYRFAGEYDLAQDFTQETFVRAFTKIGMFRGEAAFGTWVAAIATTVSLNQLRKIKRFRTREVELNEGMRGGRRGSGVEPDVRADLHRAIDNLPERSRAVFILHDVEGYTHEEIGKILGIHTGTSKSQLFRARRRLRKALAVHAGEWAS